MALSGVNFMTRRRFLAFLGLAPIVVPAVIQAAATAPVALAQTNPLFLGELGIWKGMKFMQVVSVPNEHYFVAPDGIHRLLASQTITPVFPVEELPEWWKLDRNDLLKELLRG